MRGAKTSGKTCALTWLAPALLCLVAFSLRLGPLWANRFHSDEALYASWALGIASGRDPLLAAAAPDKPPLLFYTMAAAFLVLGRIEVAARLVGLAAGVISVALVWRLALIIPLAPFFSHTWEKKGEADVAAAAMALSPFAISFSPTAFLDPLMVMFALAALVAATRKRPGWAGALLGLAVATKVQALIFLPLAMVYGVWVIRRAKRSLVIPRFILGLVIPMGIVLLWDRWRGGAPFWIQQTIHYGGIRLIYASEVMPRLTGWLSFLPYFFGWPMLIALIVGVPLLLIYDLTRGARTRAAAFDLTLITFALGHFFLHWLLAFPVWDRYWLGLVPVMCLLIGRLGSLVVSGLGSWGTGRFGDRFQDISGVMAVALVGALLIVPAVQASQSAIPVGGDHGPHDGIDRVETYLCGLPYGAVVYDHWLGWEMRYYLWDARVYVAYFATPEALAEDLRVFGRTSPRYIVFPAGESTVRVERAMAAQGFAMSSVLSTQDRHGQPTFTLYRILSADR